MERHPAREPGSRSAEAIDLYIERLARLRDEIVGGSGAEVEATFDEAKRARLRLAAKPTVRAGVAVLQIEVPDRPGALADLTATLGRGEVNIEDLQIVHSPEGGRGTVHLTVAAEAADRASAVLGGRSASTRSGSREAGNDAGPDRAGSIPSGEHAGSRRQVDRAPMADPGRDRDRV